MSVLIQPTKRNQTMLINHNIKTGNMLIPSTDELTRPIDVGINLPTNSTPTLPTTQNLLLNFDASSINPETDVDPTTLNILSVKNLVDNALFTLYGRNTSQNTDNSVELYGPRFQQGGLTNAQGYIGYRLQEPLQLNKIDHLYSFYTVFGTNNNQIAWNDPATKNGMLFSTVSRENTGYCYVLSILANVDARFRIICNRNYFSFSLPNDSPYKSMFQRRDDSKYIMKVFYEYNNDIITHTMQLLLTTLGGDIILNETRSAINAWDDKMTDMFLSVAGVENWRNQGLHAIYQSLFYESELTNEEEYDTLSYFLDKWG